MASGMLRRARCKPSLEEFISRGRLRLELGFAQAVLLDEEEQFDFVIMGFGFLSYCGNREQVLRHVRDRLLKDGTGLAYVSFYQRDAAYYDVWKPEIEGFLGRAEHARLISPSAGRSSEEKDSVRRAFEEAESFRSRLPLATVIDRGECALLVVIPSGLRVEVLHATPTSVEDFKQLAYSCGFVLKLYQTRPPGPTVKVGQTRPPGISRSRDGL